MPDLTFVRQAIEWLAAIDPALPRALLIALVFGAVYVLRKLFPRAWELFARVVPVPVIDAAPLLVLLSKTWQALPAAVLGAAATALTTGGDVRLAVKGAVFGALAALAHEFAKAAPWLPYRGAVGKLKPPVLPVLYLFALAAFVSVQPGIQGCGPGQWQTQQKVLNAVATLSNDVALPALGDAYEDALVRAAKAQPDQESAALAVSVLTEKWARVWRAYAVYVAAVRAWQVAIDTEGDTLATAAAARAAFCQLRALALERKVELPDFPALVCS